MVQFCAIFSFSAESVSLFDPLDCGEADVYEWPWLRLIRCVSMFGNDPDEVK
jgi:hypothetical protein